MKANCWFGKHSVEVTDVPDPTIQNPRDAIVRITSTAICGSDLHLYNGLVPTMEKGDILGHEFMGEVVEVGGAVHNLAVGDRVVVPFPISCGRCFACQRRLFFSVRELEPQSAARRKALRAIAGRALRVFPHARRLSGRTGAICACPVRRRGPHQGLAERLLRRAIAVSVGHLLDRVHGGRELRHPSRRRDRGLGVRAGRAVRDQERVHARGRTRHWDRSISGAASHGTGARRRGDHRLRGCRRFRRAERDDRRAWPRRLHRRRRHGSPFALTNVRLRPCEAGRHGRGRPPPGAPASVPRVPQRRHGLDRRCTAASSTRCRSAPS
jgi:hypothetical protein